MTRSHQEILKVIGRKGDLTSKVRESLVSIGRVLLYLANEADSMRWAKETRSQLRGMQRDVQSLSDHATYLSNKITFLLDAMLGVVIHRAEQHHQDLLDCRGRADAADAGRVDLRHELQAHAGARLDARLSAGHRVDADRGRAAVFHLQMEEMAVTEDQMRARCGVKTLR